MTVTVIAKAEIKRRNGYGRDYVIPVDVSHEYEMHRSALKRGLKDILIGKIRRLVAEKTGYLPVLVTVPEMVYETSREELDT